MDPSTPTRRHFLGSAALSVAATPVVFATSAAAHSTGDESFTYEIQRSEEAWRAMLSEDEYRILREGGTEPRFSSELWQEERPGHYHCRGCDLTLYDADWKTLRLIGWVFYFHSRENAVLTSIDELPPEMGEVDEMDTPDTMLEVHCRRCGSHLGHIVNVEGDVLHCINGASLVFSPEDPA